MAKKNKKQEYTTEKVIDSLNETAHLAENFFERHSKIIVGAFIGLALIGIGYFAYLKTVLEPKSEKAFIEMAQADEYFKQDSVVLALKGSPGSFLGYEQIIENYGGTKGANIALYKAGVSYYKLGDYASAVKSFEKFSSKDNILTAQKNGMIGNALVESGKEKEALPYYVKAAEGTDLEVIQTLYYMKAGKLAMDMDMNKEALNYFEAIAKKYPNAGDGEVDKYIERLKYATSGN